MKVRALKRQKERSRRRWLRLALYRNAREQLTAFMCRLFDSYVEQALEETEQPWHTGWVRVYVDDAGELVREHIPDSEVYLP